MSSQRRQSSMPVEKRKHPRVIQACNSCRVKKHKCDGHIPCSHCRRQGRECVFQGGLNSFFSRSEYSIGYVREREESLERVKELEMLLKKAQAALRDQTTSQEVKTNHPQMVQERQNAKEQQQQQPFQLQGQPQKHFQPRIENNEAGVSSAISVSLEPLAATVCELDKEVPENCPGEVMDINGTTGRFEFHGKLSSLSFLDRLMRMKESLPNRRPGEDSSLGSRNRQVISEFQNESFTNDRESPRDTEQSVAENYYPLHAFLFIDSYFKTLHFVYPILDQDVFLQRCHSIWTGHGLPIHQSFKALYFAVLSLGALTRTWTEGFINGMDRYAWTRVLFEKAEILMQRPGSLNDLEAVQALMVMAQVCQHQLNPNLAYTYLGLAVRTAFSAGINRLAQFRDPKFPQDSNTSVVSRTWWGLYSLETESSFNLGRPDILGSDCCHNRPPPLIREGSEITIIPAMIGLSQIMREVSRRMYSEPTGLSEKLQRASECERDLNNWLTQLPSNIRPDLFFETTQSNLILGSHYWPKLQMLVLKSRYLHVRIVLFYVFFLLEQKGSQGGRVSVGAGNKLSAYAQNCKDAAIEIIKTIHLTYSMHHFFRSWWNNTTYIAFGMSILISTLAREPAAAHQNSADLQYINQAFEMLGVMDECFVARNIKEFFQDFVDSLLAASTSPSDRRSGPQTDSAQPDRSIDPDPGLLAGYVDAFNFDLNNFSFFNTNFPIPLDERNQDAGFQAVWGHWAA